MPVNMKNTYINAYVPRTVILRLKLFMLILRFAVWVGGFGGVEMEVEDGQR